MFAALKVMKSKRSYYETAKDEVDLLECIREADSHEARRSVTTLLNYFTVDSIFGTHFVMVFGVLGPNLYKFLQKSQYQGIPLPVVKQIARESIRCLDFLHSKCKIIHTDIKPENICIQVSKEYVYRLAIEAYNWQRSGEDAPSAGHVASFKPKTFDKVDSPDPEKAKRLQEHVDRQIAKQIETKSLKVDLEQPASSLLPDLLDPNCEGVKCKLADIGNACWTYKHFASDIQTRQYMSPEVFLRTGYDTSADIWSMACTLFEIAVGALLFRPKASQHWTKDEDHARLYTEFMIGNGFNQWPKRLIMYGSKSKNYFNEELQLKNKNMIINPWSLKQRIVERGIDERDAEEFAEFLSKMLHPDPARRLSAKELLEDKWLN